MGENTKQRLQVRGTKEQLAMVKELARALGKTQNEAIFLACLYMMVTCGAKGELANRRCS